MIRRIIAIDPGLTGTGLVDLVMDREQITDVLDMTVIKPPAKGDYPKRFQALYTGVLNWLDVRCGQTVNGTIVPIDYLIEQPTSDWTAARSNARGQGHTAILGGAWGICCLPVAQRVNPERIHMVPSGKWIPSRTRKATYLAIVEAAEKHDAKVQGREPFLTDQSEHIIACAGIARFYVMEQERAANLERLRS